LQQSVSCGDPLRYVAAAIRRSGHRCHGREIRRAAVIADRALSAPCSAVGTRTSDHERLAVVIWPADTVPTFVVCNIEESLARREGSIEDVRIYVEYAQSPTEPFAKPAGKTGLTTSSITDSFRVLYFTSSLCWVDTTIASMPSGRPSSE